MKTYEFEVIETLRRVVRVDADSASEAETIVSTAYDNENIVLDAEDMYGDEQINLIKTYNTTINESEYGVDHFIYDEDGLIDKFDD